MPLICLSAWSFTSDGATGCFLIAELEALALAWATSWLFLAALAVALDTALETALAFALCTSWVTHVFWVDQPRAVMTVNRAAIPSAPMASVTVRGLVAG